jgi:hypothetical protein
MDDRRRQRSPVTPIARVAASRRSSAPSSTCAVIRTSPEPHHDRAVHPCGPSVQAAPAVGSTAQLDLTKRRALKHQRPMPAPYFPGRHGIGGNGERRPR